jgi:toxin-antitoxin system PIN domain toxin
VNLPDSNILLYAVNEGASQHEGSRRWLDNACNGREPVGFAWNAVLAFLRLSTKVGLFPKPLTVEQANARVRAWLETDPAVVVHPTTRHAGVLAGLLEEVGTGGNLVSDAHLAALAVEHDATVVSFDTDFDRFSGVRRRSPATA